MVLPGNLLAIKGHLKQTCPEFFDPLTSSGCHSRINENPNEGLLLLPEAEGKPTSHPGDSTNPG
jgi:hypothetical protein